MSVVKLILFIAISIPAFAEITNTQLSTEIASRLNRVPEFDFIQQEANKLGVKVYLFGGTASTFAHYVRWDLEREAGDGKYQRERFDYDFTNIYRGNQDLDIVVDGNYLQAQELEVALKTKYPHFMGTRQAWEVRLLRKKVGDKLPLLDNKDFFNQHSDSNSTGLLTINPSGEEPILRDLLDWKNPNSRFLTDVAAGRITYLFNNLHKTTKRFRKKKNPPVLSAIRYLAKLTQFELNFTDEDLTTVTDIIHAQDFSKLSDYGKKKVMEFGLKSLLNSPNVEFANEILERTGLKDKLISLDYKRRNTTNSTSWWMKKEPLKSSPVENHPGRTAEEIFEKDENGDIIVSHETGSFTAFESITRATTGGANVFISRKRSNGEMAVHGNGFYTSLGNIGARGTGFTVRFKLDPRAVEGKDFKYVKNMKYVVIKNKSVLQVILEDIDISLKELFELFKTGKVGPNDMGLIQKLKRKYKRQGLSSNELSEIEEDLKKLDWDQKNYYAFVFWYTSGFFKKDPGIILSYLKSNAYQRDPTFGALLDSDLKIPVEIRELIYEELSLIDINKISTELGQEVSIDSNKRLYLATLIAIFNIYNKVSTDSKSVDYLDQAVLELMKKITYWYRFGGDSIILLKKKKQEIHKIASYLYDKVRSSTSYNDDLALMYFTALKIMKQKKRIRYYYSDLITGLTASTLLASFFGAVSIIPAATMFNGNDGANGLSAVMVGSSLLTIGYMLNEFTKYGFKTTAARKAFANKFQEFISENEKNKNFEEFRSYTCKGILIGI